MKYLIGFLTYLAVRSLRNKLKDITEALETIKPHVTLQGYYDFCWKVREHNNGGSPKRFKFYSHGLLISIKVTEGRLITVITTDEEGYKLHCIEPAQSVIDELDLKHIVGSHYRNLYGVKSE